MKNSYVIEKNLEKVNDKLKQGYALDLIGRNSGGLIAHFKPPECLGCEEPTTHHELDIFNGFCENCKKPAINLRKRFNGNKQK